MTSRNSFKVLMLACLISVLLVPTASARIRGGHVFVGPAYGYGYGYGLGWYDPFWGSYPYGAYSYAPATGTIKFDTSNKDAGVFVQGGYAGTVGKLKSLHLRPGTYNIEVRAAGTPTYSQRVYVAAGKTVHINPTSDMTTHP